MKSTEGQTLGAHYRSRAVSRTCEQREYTGSKERHPHVTWRTGSIREVKEDGALEKGSLLPPTCISCSAEYLVSFFTYHRSLGSHKHEVRAYTLL